MALMFSRIANNFVKNGYFPTDEVTLGRILSAISTNVAACRIIDPCCGEGSALAEIKHHLQQLGAAVTAVGVEFDAERAWHAKQMLDRAIHSDIQNVMISRHAAGLLFLNPPYGNVVSDGAKLGERERADRLEKVFFRRTLSVAQINCVLVLIVPFTVLDQEFAELIARNYEQVTVHLAPETKFKQAVIMGVKRRNGHPPKEVVDRLRSVGRGEACETLPEVWSATPYEIPQQTADADFRCYAVKFDAKQLDDELQRYSTSTLWPRFNHMFRQLTLPVRRPLMPLSQWHLALALAAGQISGVVQSKDGRRVAVKGSTYKSKDRRVEIEHGDGGEVIQTVIMTDKFVPTIKGIDLTPGENLGEVLTIQ